MGKSILTTIGNTPLVEIGRLNPNPRVRLLAKLEYMNPGGSIKDRAALAMIEAGEASGLLTPDKTVIEATSGNTGIGLAMVCAVKGYRLLLAMSELASRERQQILQARGAELLLTPGHLGTDGAIEEVYRLALENPDRYFMADQFNNVANWQAHYHGTAEELWEQADGHITELVATMGTTGTLMGLSRRLKELDSAIRIVGVEPYLGHRLQGLKNMKEAYRPEIFEKTRLDEKINVDDDDAFAMTRKLATHEGLFVGMSSGAAIAVARRRAEQMDSGTVVAILPDGGERYLSTPVFAVRDTSGFSLFNTMSRRKETFEPIVDGKVGIYSCGPTAHAPLHLGQCRRYVFADLLCRYLTYRGYTVNHVMNITDLDDKTIDGSERAGKSLSDFTSRHIESFMHDMALLGLDPNTDYPRASEHVDDMMVVAEQLLKKGIAYEKMRSLYFDISRHTAYGCLSGVDLNKIRLGATVDLDDYEKDNPRDFTLFRRSTLAELKRGIFTKTPWGNARPAWHIQCAAISMAHLGETFDIHTSGRELVFPHHENENAIASAITGEPLARYWMHCDTVQIDGKAVDPNGGGLTLGDLIARGYDARQIRWWLLTTHYRKPVGFSDHRMANAAKALERLDKVMEALMTISEEAPEAKDIDQILYDIRHGFIAAMDDDLNISAAIASVFIQVKRINRRIQRRQIGMADARRIVDAFRGVDAVLNVMPPDDAYEDPEVVRMLAERETARHRGEWELADRLRDELVDRGIAIRDLAPR